ncbi:MAG: TadE/TadG family type IV pilus assembly protein [Caulobacterales bacterium]
MSAAKNHVLRRLTVSDKGATAVEFALLMAPLFALILASLQLAIIFFTGQTLQTVAIASGRELMTGTVQKAGDTKAQFKTIVCNNAPSIFQCGNLMVDVQSAGAYSSINTSPLTVTYNGAGAVTNTWSYSPGGPGDIVIMRVMYNWPIVGGPFAVGLANQANGSHLLVATTVFKNEPYQ